VRNGTVVTTARTNSTGEFRMVVAPGAYTIVATSVGGYRSTAQQEAVVRAGQTTRVELVLDTGIR
jgi:hypothetical protein